MSKATKIFSIIFLGVSLAGCATAHKMNSLSLGMSKQDVIKNLGRPVSTSAQNGMEYLSYRFFETDDDAFMGTTTPYYVRIVDGKVESYGKIGDFDSVKIPETKTTVDLNVKADSQ